MTWRTTLKRIATLGCIDGSHHAHETLPFATDVVSRVVFMWDLQYRVHPSHQFQNFACDACWSDTGVVYLSSIPCRLLIVFRIDWLNRSVWPWNLEECFWWHSDLDLWKQFFWCRLTAIKYEPHLLKIVRFSCTADYRDNSNISSLASAVVLAECFSASCILSHLWSLGLLYINPRNTTWLCVVPSPCENPYMFSASLEFKC